MAHYSSSRVRAFVVLIFAPITALATPQVTADLSNGASYTFDIGSKLPAFTFKVIPNKVNPDDFGNPQSTIRDVEVFRGNSSQPVQHLTGCEFTEMEPPQRGRNWFRTEDINFDGYEDIYILTNWGATGNEAGCVWLYSRASERFDYSPEFSKLSRHWLDPATKMILTFERAGAAGMNHTANKYAVEKNLPVLIYSEDQGRVDDNDFHCKIQERRNGAMATTFEDTGEAPPPCNSGSVFQTFFR